MSEDDHDYVPRPETAPLETKDERVRRLIAEMRARLRGSSSETPAA